MQTLPPVTMIVTLCYSNGNHGKRKHYNQQQKKKRFCIGCYWEMKPNWWFATFIMATVSVIRIPRDSLNSHNCLTAVACHPCYVHTPKIIEANHFWWLADKFFFFFLSFLKREHYMRKLQGFHWICNLKLFESTKYQSPATNTI